MLKIRRDDIAQAIKGKDRGKKGKVIKLFLEEKKALVEGINLVKKHMRQSRQDQKGGIVSIEKPISLSNLMVICKSCNRPARIGFKTLTDGTKSRFCKSCNESI